MRPLDEFRDFVKAAEPLAPLTWFRLGGPAEFLARPKTIEHLVALLKRCRESDVPCKILSGGTNVLVRDEGVRGVVVHLESPAFADVKIDGRRVESGAAVPLTALISQTARAGLAGLEILTGIPGTVGGALRANAGDRQGSIGQFVQRITVIDANDTVQTRERDDLGFSHRSSQIDDPVILSAEFQLDPEEPEAVVKRMRRIWIVKKENQPYGHQSSGFIFRDPAPEISARVLIEQAGLKGARVGGAEISDRHANYIVAQAGATTVEVLQLIDHIRDQVASRCGYDLELQIQVW